MEKKFIVGSRAFFSGMPDFLATDSDFLIIVDNPIGFQWRDESHIRGVCTFRYKREPIAQMIQRTLDSNDPITLCKFLVPEVAKYLNASVSDLEPLRPLLDKLDIKHRYYRTIFEAYMQNGDFYMSDRQRADAYEEYRTARKNTRRSRRSTAAPVDTKAEQPTTECPPQAPQGED